MKRKQTRFTTEEQILDRIDHQKALASELMDFALKEDAMAQACLDEIAKLSKRPSTQKVQEKINTASVELRAHRERAVRMNKRRHSIEQKTLPRLKNTLAAFRTEPMPFSDRAVVLQ